jgi:predicted enzyme related to lactoylglutathione lyase
VQFTTAQSVDDVANRIKANGGTLATEPADMPWGGRIFRLQDPDGFKFAISSPLRPNATAVEG